MLFNKTLGINLYKRKIIGGIRMKQNVIIAVVLCLALSIFVGWNFYKNNGAANKPILIYDSYAKGN